MFLSELLFTVFCCTFLRTYMCTCRAAVGTTNVQDVSVMSFYEVEELSCVNIGWSNWTHRLQNVFSANKLVLNYKDVAVGKFNITAIAYEAVSGNASHAVLVEGSKEALQNVGVALLSTEVPVIAVPPSHSWFSEGHKVPNVLVPRFGQSLKGFAAVDMVKPPSAASTELVTIYRGARSSPELDMVIEAHKSAPGLHLHQFVLTKEITELAATLSGVEDSGEVIFDSSIIDCPLDVFGGLVNLLTYLPTNTVIHTYHVVIFLQEFYEVAEWPFLSDLSLMTSYIFAFRQRVPVRPSREESHWSEYDINAAVKYDTLEALANASACINLTNLTYVNIKANNESFPFTVFNEGLQVVKRLEEMCIKGMAGSLGFTTGHRLSPDCLDESLVVFDIMKLTLSDHSKERYPHCLSNWDVVGNWSKSEGLQMNEQLWTLSLSRDTTVHSLRVLVADFQPFAYQQDTRNGWRGIDFDLFNRTFETIQTVLVNQIDFIKWNGSRDSISHNFMTGNYQYDIAIGGIPVRPGREQIYSRAYFTSSLGIMQRSTNSNGNYRWRFLSPFTWTVWLTVLGMILLSGFVCRWLNLSGDYSQSIWLAFSTVFFLQENRIAVMANPWGRIFIVAYSLFVLVLTSTYTANLVSFLSPMPPSAAVSLRELVRVPVVALSSSPHLELLRDSAALKNIQTANSIPEAIESLRNGTVDAFLSEHSLLLHILSVADAECDLAVVRSGFFKQQFAFALSQNFSLSHGSDLDSAIQDAVTSGFVLESYRRHLLSHEVSSYKCPTENSFVESFDNPNQDSNEETPLDYDNMAGIFIITVTTAALVLSARIILLLWKHRKQIKVAFVVSA